MMRKYPWLFFVLVLGWKVALFIFTQQPVPANDAFFYDGAVIHHLLHGGYYNPCVALAFPISGREVFSAYPPGYQLALLGWMKLFGVSALSAMALHLLLFILYALTLLAIFRRMQIPAWCVNLTGFFLLGFTFHDRPDSFAHLMGILAVYACVRSRKLLGRDAAGQGGGWVWMIAAFIILAVCGSLQIGATYFGVVLIATIAACRWGGERMPLLPMALAVVVPMALVLVVKFALPRAWAGFMENVDQTPFITGFRIPHWQEVAKVVRTVPGILLVTVFSFVAWLKQRDDLPGSEGRRLEVMLLATLLPALGILAACVTILSPNTVAIANYLQPLIVASFLALSAPLKSPERWLRLQVACLALAILLGSVRAVGMTTWGVACARDFGYAKSVQRVQAELKDLRPENKVVMSSAFLYAAAGRNDGSLIHSDWMTRAGGDSRVTDVQALIALKPARMILTQYDYYRRFEAVLEHAKGDASLKEIKIKNLARTRTPDSYKALQQLVQHISWAPVIVDLTWER